MYLMLGICMWEEGVMNGEDDVMRGCQEYREYSIFKSPTTSMPTPPSLFKNIFQLIKPWNVLFSKPPNKLTMWVSLISHQIGRQ